MAETGVVVFGGPLYRLPFRCGELRRPRDASRRFGTRTADDLCAFARGLLHVLDVLRLGRARRGHRPRVPDHLYRPDPDDRPRLSAHSPHRSPPKAERITSVADFIAARYGKNELVAASPPIAVVGTLPMSRFSSRRCRARSSPWSDRARHPRLREPSGSRRHFTARRALARAFAILFGTRHVDATEHQEGLMLAIATESVVKLVAFLVIGIFVTFGCSTASPPLRGGRRDGVAASFFDPDDGTWVAMALLYFVCDVLLPRQFHVRRSRIRASGSSSGPAGCSRSIWC